MSRFDRHADGAFALVQAATMLVLVRDGDLLLAGLAAAAALLHAGLARWRERPHRART